MQLTDQNITDAVNGTLNRQQADMLLLSWPPPKNWKEKLRGKNWSIEWYAAFKGCKKELIKTPKNLRKKQKKLKTFLKNNGVKVSEFYTSFEWLKLRMEVIKKYGAVCACCGSSPKKDRIKINVDHIKPRKEFPELELVFDNLQVLCSDCNKGKGNWDKTDWRD